MFCAPPRKSRWVFLILALPTLVGCGRGGATATVSGTVTYEGAPLTNGSVSFAPVDGKGPTNGGPITKGRYRVSDLLPGQKRVEILGSLAAGATAKSPAEPPSFKESIEKA